MLRSMEMEELTAVFAELGARDPGSWAESQINEGINQLGRFLFLKGAWDLVVDDADTSWIDRTVERTPLSGDGPYDGIGHALRQLLTAGADMDDINQVVRGKQAELLFGLCYLLADPSSVAGNVHQQWALFEIDENDRPIRLIDMLHESVLDTDPTGREMRPRPAP